MHENLSRDNHFQSKKASNVFFNLEIIVMDGLLVRNSSILELLKAILKSISTLEKVL
jgi:hypothetical protein